MLTDRIIRPTLFLNAGYNVLVAWMFAFPVSKLAQMVGMAWPPAVYRAVVTAFVVSFALLYLWLATRTVIDRGLVGFSALVKVAVFGAIAVCWLSGFGSRLGLLTAAVDLIFAALMLWWLRRPA